MLRKIFACVLIIRRCLFNRRRSGCLTERAAEQETEKDLMRHVGDPPVEKTEQVKSRVRRVTVFEQQSSSNIDPPLPPDA
jgi:hypothetical protein